MFLRKKTINFRRTNEPKISCPEFPVFTLLRLMMMCDSETFVCVYRFSSLLITLSTVNCWLENIMNSLCSTVSDFCLTFLTFSQELFGLKRFFSLSETFKFNFINYWRKMIWKQYRWKLFRSLARTLKLLIRCQNFYFLFHRQSFIFAARYNFTSFLMQFWSQLKSFFFSVSIRHRSSLICAWRKKTFAFSLTGKENLGSLSMERSNFRESTGGFSFMICAGVRLLPRELKQVESC